METILVWVLSVQLWTDPPPAIKLIYTKDFVNYDECMAERAKWDKKFVSLCVSKVVEKK